METEIIEKEIPKEELLQSEEDEVVVDLVIEEEEPPEDIDIPHTRKIIEAVLFAAGYPVGYNTLAKVLEISPGAAKKIVREYAEEYNRASQFSWS